MMVAVEHVCPDVKSGNGGVTSSGVQDGSAAVAGLPSVSPSRTAVTGRQKLQCFFSLKQAISESALATSAMAIMRAVCIMSGAASWRADA